MKKIVKWIVVIVAVIVAVGLLSKCVMPKNIERLICNHEWSDGEVTKEATCEEDGELTKTCLSCGKKKKEPIIAVGHVYENDVCIYCGIVNSIFLAEVGDDVSGRTVLSKNVDTDSITAILRENLFAYANDIVFEQYVKIELSNGWHFQFFVTWSKQDGLDYVTMGFYHSIPDETGTTTVEGYSFEGGDLFGNDEYSYTSTFYNRTITIPAMCTVVNVEKTDNLDEDFWKLVKLVLNVSAGGVTV